MSSDYWRQYRAKGLCGQCGLNPSTKFQCEPCRDSRNTRERETRKRLKLKEEKLRLALR